jgi:exonuclease SbcC
MIIRSIKLKDFISHANTNIELPLGVTVIIGPNGAGKTSIIDGIIFALFGDKVRGERITDSIRRGANSAEVEVVLEDSGREYTVKRVRRSRNSEATLMRDGSQIASGSSVSSELSKLLKADRDTVIKSILVRQGEVANLIDEEPSKRKELMGKLIGLDKLENAWNNMNEVIKHFKERVEDYKVVKREIDLKRDSEKNVKEIIGQLERDINNIKYDLEKTKEEMNEAYNELNFWKEKENKHNQLRQNLVSIDEKINATQNNLKRCENELKEAENAKQEMCKIEPEIKKISLIEDYVNLSRDRINIDDDINRLREDLAKIEDLLNTVEQAAQGHKRYVELDKKLKELKDKRKDLQATVNEYQEVEKKIDNTRYEISHLEQQILNIEQKALEILQYATVEAKNAKLKEINEEAEEVDKRISHLQQEYGYANEKISEIEKYLKILADSTVCPICHTQLTPEHRERVQNDFKHEKETLQRKIDNIEAEREVEERKRKDTDDKRSKINAVEVERLERLKAELHNSEVELDNILKKEDELKPCIEENRKVEEEISRTEELIHDNRESYDEYLGAEKALKGLRSKDEIVKGLSDLKNRSNEIDKSISLTLDKLGYTPKRPQDELNRLRELQKKYEVAKSKAEEIPKITEEIKYIERQLKSLVDQKRSIEKELEDLGYSDEKHRMAEKRYNELSNNVTEFNTRLKEKERELDRRRDELRNIEEELKNLEAKLSSLEKIQKFIGKLENIRGAFSRDGIQKILRKKVAPIISEYARNYIENFNLDITDVSVNEDFDISVVKQSGEISIKSISGGEKVAVAIALRLAIANALIGKISTIIMDEPTIYLDEERRKELVEVMKSFFRESSKLPQMIIVTHHRELEEVADQLYNIKKVNGVSVVEIPEFVK